jgi:hypothetical protein
MTVWVLRNGQLVNKASLIRKAVHLTFPSPRISRFDSFESPITGETISSWRQRDADMQAGSAVDPRDLPRGPFEERAATNARRTADAPFQWRDQS